MSTEKDIGARLRQARKNKNFQSAADAARALNIAYPTYAGHENGNRGLRSSLERYAKFFGVSVEWLLTGRGSPSGMKSSSEEENVREQMLAHFDKLPSEYKEVALRQLADLSALANRVPQEASPQKDKK